MDVSSSSDALYELIGAVDTCNQLSLGNTDLDFIHSP